MFNQKSPPQAIPDPSSVDLGATSSGPAPQVAAPVMGGPPVGLGGPGNLSALNKKDKGKPGAPGGRDRVPAPANRKSIRKKSAPPAPLAEYLPSEKVVDKWQSGGAVPTQPRPGSAAGSTAGRRTASNTSSHRGSSHQRESSLRRSTGDLSSTMPGLSNYIDRTRSMPALARPVAGSASGKPPRR